VPEAIPLTEAELTEAGPRDFDPRDFDPRDFDPLDPATLQCPHAWYAGLRETAPVHFVESRGLWFVTSRELVYEALRHPELFSSRFGRPQSAAPPEVAHRVAAIESQGWPYVPTLLTEDPPEHNRYRRLVSRAFTARYVQQLGPAIEDIVAALLDAVLAREEVEFVSEFAAPLPLTVIARVLGVPEERQADFKRWSDEITLTIGGNVDAERHVARARQVLAFQQYFAAELEQRRRQPADDLLTGLVHAHVSSSGADDAPLSTAACLAIVTQLLVAGNETTTKLLTGTMHLLAGEPSWWKWLQADPASRAGRLAEEALRYLSPVQGMFRVLTSPTTLGGVQLPAGARVVLSFAAANRDEAAFAEAETFNPDRPNAADHLAFGQGVHYCLGAPLARLETAIALRQIACRASSVALAPGNDLRYQPSFLLRGLERLQLRLVPADPGFAA
jgi:cytochrome P450